MGPYSKTGEGGDPLTGMTQHIVNAIIFLPAGLPLDGDHIRMCVAHIERRGYRLVTVLREWHPVLQMLGAREATVVVFADREHFDPDWEPRVEFCGEDTQNLITGKRARNAPPASGGYGRRPKRLI